MLYILWGIIIGIALNLLPLWEPSIAIEIYPEWHGALNRISDISPSWNNSVSEIRLGSVSTEKGASLLMGSGAELYKIDTGDYLISLSGSGEYIGKYQKTGQEVEFLNIQGERFWKLKSNEYPFLSYNGKIVLLLNGDQSRIRVLDFNGNVTGIKEIEGRICTVISFSKYSDFAGIGFLDGGYYILDMNGAAALTGHAPSEAIVKGIAVSAGGSYAAVHYGNNNGDSIALLYIPGKEEYTIPLNGIHLAKSAINVTEDGYTSIIDYNRIIIADSEGKIRTVIKIPQAEFGTSSIDCFKGLYSAAYKGMDGIIRSIVFLRDGTVLSGRKFPGESFMELIFKGPVLLLKGSENLYCYSFYYQGPE